MSDIRFEGWLHRSGTGGVYQDSAGNVGIASTQPQTRLDIGNGGFQVGPTGIATVTTVNTTNIVNSTPLSHRNIIINGAMRVAQRATTYTGADNYNSVDRFKVIHSGLNEDVTSAQVDVSGAETDSPLLKGITKAWRITNGNQTGGAGTADLLSIQYRIEAQDLRNSGWVYTSTTSFVTLSFYVKSSVAQNFAGFLRSHDGTQMTFPFETGALTANTWKKITITLPGNASLQFDNDTNCGMEINISQFWGTDYTTSGKTLDAWSAYDNAARLKDFPASTWYTTNDATFELTGVQFELGSVATPFEHRSYGDEMARCQRYFFKNINESGENGCNYGKAYSANEMFASVRFPTPMRATPTITTYGNGGTAGQVHKLGNPDISYTSVDRLDLYGGMRFNSSSAWATGDTDMYSFTFQAAAEI